jgi:hypothetical protein
MIIRIAIISEQLIFVMQARFLFGVETKHLNIIYMNLVFRTVTILTAVLLYFLSAAYVTI